MEVGKFSAQPVSAISPPISMLTEDVLWFIFNINVDDPGPVIEDKVRLSLPLDITRVCLQVCHEWRKILLSTPSIWGRLMDWRSLNQATDHWREEVLRRSGTSLLWIRGCADIPYSSPHIVDFFANLVEGHWERIERCSALFAKYGNSTIAGIQKVVQNEAPNLENIVFTVSSFTLKQQGFRGVTLFAGHAPRLRVFDATWMYCELEASWMSNIRELSLGCLFTMEEVCKALLYMPLLQSLKLESRTTIDRPQSPPTIHLPQLRKLSLNRCTYYLRAIVPAPGCILDLRDGEPDLPAEVYRSYVDLIAKMLCSYLSFHPPREVYVLYIWSIITLRVGECYIGLSIEAIENDILACLFDMIASPLFSTVTDLTLSLECVTFEPQVYRAFKRFITSFLSLDRLLVHGLGIDIFLEETMVDPRHIIFPNLGTLKIIELTDNSESDDDNTSRYPWRKIMERFLSLRRRLGIQIMTLDLTSCNPEYLGDLDSLDEFVGMKIIWVRDGNQVEYESGEGHPENLQFYSQSKRRKN